MASPDIQVAHHDSGISALPAQIDTVSQRGCKSQSYTSWAWLPHSYVLGGRQRTVQQDDQESDDDQNSNQDGAEVVVAQAMTPAIWKSLGKTIYEKYQNQRVMYDIASSALMTAKELARKYSLSTTAINYLFQNNLDLKIKKLSPEQKAKKEKAIANLMKDLASKASEKIATEALKQKDRRKPPLEHAPATGAKSKVPTLDKTPSDPLRSPSAKIKDELRYAPETLFPGFESMSMTLGLDEQGHVRSTEKEAKPLDIAKKITESVNTYAKEISSPRLLSMYTHQKNKWKTSSDMYHYGNQDTKKIDDLEKVVLIKLTRLAMFQDIITWLTSGEISFIDGGLSKMTENLALEYLVYMADELDVPLENYDGLPNRKRRSVGQRPNTNIRSRRHTEDDLVRWNVDRVPVRYVLTTSSIVANLDPEFSGSPEAYTSTLYDSLITKLNDPISANPLGSMVRGPNIIDYNSLLVLVKQMASRTSCIHDVTPLVRALCISTALNINLANHDPTPYQFITRTVRPRTREITINITPFSQAEIGSLRLVAMDWVSFTKFISRQINPFPDVMTPSGMDQTWVAIPVRAHQLTSTSLLLYIMSFLSSKFWNGTITVDTLVSSPVFGRDGRIVRYVDHITTTMPPTSSVHIPGPSNAILVVIDWETPVNTPQVVVGNGTVVPTYIPGQAIIPADVSPAWVWYWTTSHKTMIRADSLVVVNEVSQYGSTKFAVDRARTIVSDIHSTLRLDIGLPPRQLDTMFDSYENTKLTDYSRNRPLKGALVFSDQRDLVPIYDGQPWLSECIAVNDRDALITSATGFNFSSLSASHGGVKNSAFIVSNTEVKMRWEMVLPQTNSPDYNSLHTSSLTRIAIRLGLYRISAPAKLYSNYEAIGQWIHLNSVAIAACTSVALTTNGYPTSEFSGWQVSKDLTDRSHELQELVSVNTAGIRQWSRLRDEKIYLDGELEDAIRARYRMDALWLSKDWYSFSPVPIFIWHQWIGKKHPTMSPSTRLKLVTTTITRDTCLALLGRQDDDPLAVIQSTVSIDIARYVPIIMSKEIESFEQPTYVYWTSPTAHLCGVVTDKTTLPDHRFLSSNVPNYRIQNLFRGYVEETPVYIKDSNSTLESSDTFNIRTSALLYPDPPLSENVQRPLRPVEEPAVTPTTAVMDVAQSQSTGDGTMQ